METKAIVYVFPALTTLPAFYGETFVNYLIGIAIAFFLTAIITYLLGFDEEDEVEALPVTTITVDLSALIAPFQGKVLPIEQVNDPVLRLKQWATDLLFSRHKGLSMLRLQVK